MKSLQSNISITTPFHKEPLYYEHFSEFPRFSMLVPLENAFSQRTSLKLTLPQSILPSSRDSEFNWNALAYKEPNNFFVPFLLLKSIYRYSKVRSVRELVSGERGVPVWFHTFGPKVKLSGLFSLWLWWYKYGSALYRGASRANL